MKKNKNLSSEQAKVLEEEQQLLLLVKQGLLMLAAEDKERNISNLHLDNIIELRIPLQILCPKMCLRLWCKWKGWYYFTVNRIHTMLLLALTKMFHILQDRKSVV